MSDGRPYPLPIPLLQVLLSGVASAEGNAGVATFGKTLHKFSTMRSIIEYRNTPPPAAFPYGRYVSIGAKPDAPSSDGPGWSGEMDHTANKFGVVIGGGAKNGAPAYLVYVATACSEGCGAHEFMYEPGWLTLVPQQSAAGTGDGQMVPPAVRASLAAAEMFNLRLLIKLSIGFARMVGHKATSKFRPGELVYEELTDGHGGGGDDFDVSAVGIVVAVERDEKNVTFARFVPSANVITLLTPKVRHASTLELRSLSTERQCAMLELHGFIKHKFEREFLRDTSQMPPEGVFVSLDPWRFVRPPTYSAQEEPLLRPTPKTEVTPAQPLQQQQRAKRARTAKQEAK